MICQDLDTALIFHADIIHRWKGVFCVGESMSSFMFLTNQMQDLYFRLSALLDQVYQLLLCMHFAWNNEFLLSVWIAKVCQKEDPASRDWKMQSNSGGNSTESYEWIHSSHNGHGFLNYQKNQPHFITQGNTWNGPSFPDNFFTLHMNLKLFLTDSFLRAW